MYRNIKKLRFADRPPTDEELSLAARQYIRKVSGYREPSKTNEDTFEEAIVSVAAATRKMFDELVMRS